MPGCRIIPRTLPAGKGLATAAGTIIDDAENQGDPGEIGKTLGEIAVEALSEAVKGRA